MYARLISINADNGINIARHHMHIYTFMPATGYPVEYSYKYIYILQTFFFTLL